MCTCVRYIYTYVSTIAMRDEIAADAKPINKGVDPASKASTPRRHRFEWAGLAPCRERRQAPAPTEGETQGWRKDFLLEFIVPFYSKPWLACLVSALRFLLQEVGEIRHAGSSMHREQHGQPLSSVLSRPTKQSMGSVPFNCKPVSSLTPSPATKQYAARAEAQTTRRPGRM